MSRFNHLSACMTVCSILIILLFSFNFADFAGDGYPDDGAFAYLRLDGNLSSHLVDDFLTDR